MVILKKKKITSVEDVEKLEPSYFAGRSPGVYLTDPKWCSHSGNSVTVPQIVKHRVTICPSNSTPRYLPTRFEEYVYIKTYT